MLPSTYLRSFVERSIECFQPIVNLNTDHRLGAETPVRFVDPDDTLRVSSGIVEQSEENLGDLETLMWRLFRSISMTIGAMLERRQKTRWSSHIPGGCQLIVLAAIVTAAGCAPVRQRAVPFELQGQAVVSGMSPAVRTWGTVLNPAFQKELVESVRRERAHRIANGQTGPLPLAEFLAISGGGSRGAFTAGFLNGWTAAGNRPEFKAVTGVSTGALIAPFAFLGPDHDATLRRFYTGVTTKDIIRRRSLLAALFDDAITDNAPLRRLVAGLVTPQLLDAIATEYRKGRLLLIGTTNLDAQQAVIWNVGLIAASGHPRALELVRDIMIASAAIPGVFPPVMIDVEVDGQHYQEMHVDGGAVARVFLYPPSLKIGEVTEAAGVRREHRVYIIQNDRIEPEWAETPRRTLGIAVRAMSLMLTSHGVGDLYRTYLNAQRDGIDYNLAWIPAEFKVQLREPFDREYMQKLFDVGFEMGRKSGFWTKVPPKFDGESPDGAR